MPATVPDTPRTPARPTFWEYTPNLFDYALAVGCLILLATAGLAIWGGRADWHRLPATYFFHFGTLAIALAITPVVLARPKATLAHRRLGYVWLGAMVSTSIISLFIRDINNGSFSPIHILSFATLVQSWRILANARNHNHVAHRRQVYILVTLALLTAGFFTFQFNRLFDMWLTAALGR